MEATIQLKKVTVNLNEYSKLFEMMLSVKKVVKTSNDKDNFWIKDLDKCLTEYETIRVCNTQS